MNEGNREPAAADLAYQDRSLQDVSRTFALTIPQLPGALSRVVAPAGGNAVPETAIISIR